MEPRGREAGARGEAIVRQAGDKFDQAVSDLASAARAAVSAPALVSWRR